MQLEVSRIRHALPDQSLLNIVADFVDIPLSIGIDFMDSEALLADNIRNNLFCQPENLELAITRKNMRMFIGWEVKAILFTKFELYRRHRQLYHRSAGKLFNDMKRAFPGKCSSTVRHTLKRIAEDCIICQKISVPHRFKITLPNEKGIFNGVIAMDIISLDVGKRKKAPVLHVLDANTHFQNAIFVKGESSYDICNASMECRSSVYVGYPRVIKTD